MNVIHLKKIHVKRIMYVLTRLGRTDVTVKLASVKMEYSVKVNRNFNYPFLHLLIK